MYASRMKPESTHMLMNMWNLLLIKEWTLPEAIVHMASASRSRFARFMGDEHRNAERHWGSSLIHDRLSHISPGIDLELTIFRVNVTRSRHYQELTQGRKDTEIQFAIQS